MSNWHDNGDEMPEWRRHELENQLWHERLSRGQSKRTPEELAEIRRVAAEREQAERRAEQQRKESEERAERRAGYWRVVGWSLYVLLTLAMVALIAIGVTTHPDLDGYGKYLMIAMIGSIVIWVITTGAIIA